MNSLKNALYEKDLLPPCMAKKYSAPEAKVLRRYNENGELINVSVSTNEINNSASNGNIYAKQTKQKHPSKEKSLTNLFSDIKRRISSADKDQKKSEAKESKKTNQRLSRIKDNDSLQESYQFQKDDNES